MGSRVVVDLDARHMAHVQVEVQKGMRDSNNSAGNSLQCKVVVINSTSLYPSFLASNYTYTNLEGAAQNA